MQSLGQKWYQDYYQLIKQFYKQIDLNVFVAIVLIVIVPFFISLVGNGWLNLLAYVYSAYIIFLAFNDQEKLYCYSRSQSYWLVLMPFYWLFIGWLFLLLSIDKFQSSVHLVMGVFFLFVVSLLPLYRRNKNWDIRKQHFSFKGKYYVVAVIGLLIQIYILWRI